MTIAQWLIIGAETGVFFILFDFVLHRLINKSGEPISIGGNFLAGMIFGPPMTLLMQYLTTIRIF